MTIEVPVPVSITAILAGGAALLSAGANFVAVIRTGKSQAVESESRAEVNRSAAAVNLAIEAGIEDEVAQRRERTSEPQTNLFLRHLSRALTDLRRDHD